MRNQFHPFRVTHIRRETDEAVTIEIKPVNHSIENFSFVPGQYLTIRTKIEGEEVRRTYSICSAPYEGVLRVGVKELQGGKFSTFANRILKVGDKLEVMPPMGKFTHSPQPDQENHYLGIAAGSGITPILSIVKTVLKEEPGSRFTLFFGNQKSNTIMFKEEIEALKNIYLDRFSIYHILSREKGDIPLFEGRIDVEKLEKFATLFFNPGEIDGAFLCGPADLITQSRDFLLEKGTDKSKIHFELFTTEGMKKPIVKSKVAIPEISGEKVSVKLRIDGNIYRYGMPKTGTSILDGAADTGADVPYACKGGVCSTCRAKLINGKVNMEVNYALEEDELERGYILTCQSYPLTEEITVDFDIK
nr:phenylacetate-CoA oxygenase/reductase subunit PaaK [Saprospiraceae bacterium]